MKVLTLLGSPRKKGNTATILGRAETELLQCGFDVERVDIVDHDIRGCMGCLKCRRVSDEPGCIQQDDTVTIFRKMMDADAVLYASPLYCWGFSSQMKALIDRHFCLVKGYKTPQHLSFIQGKPTSLLVTCGGPIQGNTDLIRQVFDRVNRFCRSMPVGKYVVPFCSTPDYLPANAHDIVTGMVKDLCNAMKETIKHDLTSARSESKHRLMPSPVGH